MAAPHRPIRDLEPDNDRERESVPGDSRRHRRASWTDIVLALDFGLAQAPETWHRALRLVHDQYVARGYMAADPSGRRLSLHHALPSTKVFVARADSSVVGTVTLIEDSPLGLPMDEIYEPELAAFRAQGRRLTEGSALAIHPRYRWSGAEVAARLVRMLVLYAAEIARLDDLCIVVNPRHVPFYRTFFRGRPFGLPTRYGKVNGAPAQAVHLDLDSVRESIHGQTATPTRFERFMYDPASCAPVLARLYRDLPESSPTSQEVAALFAGHDLLDKATVADLAYVCSLHPALSTRNLRVSRDRAARWMAWRRPVAAAATVLLALGLGIEARRPPASPPASLAGMVSASGSLSSALSLPTPPDPSVAEAIPGAPEEALASFTSPAGTGEAVNSPRVPGGEYRRRPRPNLPPPAGRPQVEAQESPAIEVAAHEAEAEITADSLSPLQARNDENASAVMPPVALGTPAAGTAHLHGTAGPVAWEVVDLRRQALPDRGEIRWSYTLLVKLTAGSSILLEKEERTARQEGPEQATVQTGFQRTEVTRGRWVDASRDVGLRIEEGVRAKARNLGFASESGLDDLVVWHRLIGKDEMGNDLRIDIRFRLDAVSG